MLNVMPECPRNVEIDHVIDIWLRQDVLPDHFLLSSQIEGASLTNSFAENVGMFFKICATCLIQDAQL